MAATKGEAIGLLVRKFCALLEKHGVMPAAEAKNLMVQKKLDVNSVVWALTNYAKKPHEAGVLREYIARELKAAEVMAGAVNCENEVQAQVKQKLVGGVLNNEVLLDELVVLVEAGLKVLYG